MQTAINRTSKRASTTTSTSNTILFIATCAGSIRATGQNHCEQSTRQKKEFSHALSKPRQSLLKLAQAGNRPMLENIIDSEVHIPTESGIFSRPNSLIFGRDSRSGNARRMAESMFSISRPPVLLENSASGCQSHSGATMLKAPSRAITPTTAPAAAHSHPCKGGPEPWVSQIEDFQA